MNQSRMRRLLLILLVVLLATQLTGCGAIQKFFRHPFSFWQDHPEDETLLIPDDAGDTGALAATEPLAGDTETAAVALGPAAQAADSAAMAAAADTPAAGEPVLAADTPAPAATAGRADTPVVTAGRTDTRPARPAAGRTDTRPARPAALTSSFRTINNNAFRAGEKLTFAIKYLGMTAGYFTMELHPTTYNNRPCFKIVSEARTASGIEWMYRMRDQLVSYIDRTGLFSWRYEKHIEESSDNKREFFDFDQVNHQLRKPDGSTEAIPPYCQDVMSAIYYVRAQNLAVGNTFTIPCYDGRKLYDLVVRVLKLEVIDVGGTRFPALLVTPLLKFQGAFRSRGQINMWVTNDARHIPLRLESRIAVGSFVADLIKVEYTQ